jgi:hypothetical protein
MLEIVTWTLGGRCDVVWRRSMVKKATVLVIQDQERGPWPERAPP